MNYFTHLHVHTDHSLLDGAITHDALIAFAQRHNIPAIGTSDHGNIFGAVKFFQKCKKAGIKPILGIESYFTEDVAVKSHENRYYHLLLIVQNRVGYKNLCKLISYAYQKGFYFKPRIDYDILARHAEGLIATTACVGGHIPSLLLNNNEQEARSRIDWFLNVFGRDRFYLEVQPEEFPEQVIVNKKLYELSAELGINCVVGCDAHYPNRDDRDAHEIMLAIQTHAKMADQDRFTFGDIRAYLKSPDEVIELFKDHPEAVWNTGRIADQCEFTFETGKLFFPKFDIPQEHTPTTYFNYLCAEGFERLKADNRIPADQYDLYEARLHEEIALITKMGFIEYFLVVSDFIQWAYRHNIPVGPGRGSAAGSMVAWALQITNIDPIKYTLLFERFLNPERVSMPDIDIDFCIEGRETVINYVKDRYGHDKVCQIITFGTMMAKGVIKDVARALGIPFEDSTMITGLIPDQLKITLHEAVEQEPRLKELIENSPTVQKLFDIAYRLEGVTRHASKHAAGIVISPEPIDDILPVYIPPKTDELVTQYDMTELEYLGFLKIDFLGLKNLTLIDRALRLIQQLHGESIDINKIPLDDSKTFALLCAGKTSGVFQLESDGLKDVLRKLQPEKFEDIIAVNALYRPGPLGSGMVDDFIERKHGRQKIQYVFPALEPILQETYGVIVYQEQVMKIATAIAGYTLGQSDLLRRAMGKKKADEMAKQRALFLAGADKLAYDSQKAGELFDLMAYFAGYGFNKSHSAAYALIAYQTAYLKANYPAPFMACLISLESSNPDAMVLYLDEAKSMGLTIVPPNINRSTAAFSVLDGALLFGLQGIKNVGQTALEAIIAEREKKPFTDLLDFCRRVDLRTVNKRVIENLICAGACDVFPGTRAQQYHELGKIIDRALEKKKEMMTGQTSLFGDGMQPADGSHDAPTQEYQFQQTVTWTDKEKLEREKEVTGFYVSEHPLGIYRKQLQWLACTPFAPIPRVGQDGQEPTIVSCGLLKSCREITTKKGDRMAFVQIEDTQGTTAELIVFPRVYKQVQDWLKQYQVFVLKGHVDAASDTVCKIKVDTLVPIELLFDVWPQINSVTLDLSASLDEQLIITLKDILVKGPVPLKIAFTENAKRLVLESTESVKLSCEVLEKITEHGIAVALSL